MELKHSRTANRVLSSLSTDDFAHLVTKLTFVELPLRRQLEQRNRPIEYVYFLENGIASVVVTGGPNQSSEVGIIGSEGMTGLSLIHESDRALHETFIQSAGSGWRIAAAEMRAAAEDSATLRTVFLRSAHCFTTQMAFTALANGRYKVEERLARWLLMAQDRSAGDMIFMTHEFLSLMLGVRRPGVTTALIALGQRGLIKAERGSVQITNRPGLEETSNGSYGAPEGEFQRLFGSPPKRH